MQVRLEQVDDLDAGLEHLEFGGLLLEASAPGGESGSVSPASIGPSSSTGSPITFSTRPSVSVPTGTVIGPPVSIAFMPRTRPSVGFMRDAAHAAFAEVLRHLGDDVDRLAA